jgi:hypothetical protein
MRDARRRRGARPPSASHPDKRARSRQRGRAAQPRLRAAPRRRAADEVFGASVTRNSTLKPSAGDTERLDHALGTRTPSARARLQPLAAPSACGDPRSHTPPQLVLVSGLSMLRRVEPGARVSTRCPVAGSRPACPQPCAARSRKSSRPGGARRRVRVSGPPKERFSRSSGHDPGDRKSTERQTRWFGRGSRRSRRAGLTDHRVRSILSSPLVRLGVRQVVTS